MDYTFQWGAVWKVWPELVSVALTASPFIALLHVLRDLLLPVSVRFLKRNVPKRTLLVGGFLALSLASA